MSKTRPYPKKEQQEEEDERDERGLTPWHYGPGARQVLCGTCNCRPCADSCPEQWLPDRLEWKAARAGLPIEEWARTHGDWTRAHAQRPDVAAWLEGQTWPLPQEQAADERRIPARAAMAQAMAVVAGEARADELAPVHEEASAGK